MLLRLRFSLLNCKLVGLLSRDRAPGSDAYLQVTRIDQLHYLLLGVGVVCLGLYEEDLVKKLLSY